MSHFAISGRARRKSTDQLFGITVLGLIVVCQLGLLWGLWSLRSHREPPVTITVWVTDPAKIHPTLQALHAHGLPIWRESHAR